MYKQLLVAFFAFAFIHIFHVITLVISSDATAVIAQYACPGVSARVEADVDAGHRATPHRPGVPKKLCSRLSSNEVQFQRDGIILGSFARSGISISIN